MATDLWVLMFQKCLLQAATGYGQAAARHQPSSSDKTQRQWPLVRDSSRSNRSPLVPCFERDERASSRNLHAKARNYNGAYSQQNVGSPRGRIEGSERICGFPSTRHLWSKSSE
eukprot:402617-Amphidinium_carterae.1